MSLSNNNETIERWLPVVGWEGMYEVSDIGRIRGVERTVPSGRGWNVTRRPKIRGLEVTAKGYLRVHLTRRGVAQKMAVHRAVAMAFVQNKTKAPQVNHLDGDKSNNMASNLEWCTASANTLHAHRVLGHKVKRKLNESSVAIIRTCGGRNIDVAAAFGVSPSLIGNIRHNRAWHRSTGSM